MAKYEFPVKLWRFTNEEFDKQKAKYIAKYGYSVNIPGFSDIIHLGLDQPPTEKELSQYSSKAPGELSVRRWEAIKRIKQKKKESFQRMMASPSPTWLSNIGSAMTFLDDVNDTLGTISMIARITAHMLPKSLGKILTGPAGWALLAADIANIGMTLSRLPVRAVALKTKMHKGLGMNPFSKKAKLSRAAKMRTIRPSKGELIEALQTTDNIFGVGLCLGPIVGLVQDVITGIYRVATGKQVSVTAPWAGLATHEQVGMNVFKAVQQLWTGGQELSDEDHARCILAANEATQVAWPIIQQWHPVDNISNINNIELRAPSPTDPTTLELFAEEGIDPRTRTGWLSTNRRYATPMDLWDSAEPKIDASFHEYCERNKHLYEGYMAAEAGVDTIQNMYALMEGEDQVQLDYSHTEKALHGMFDQGLRFHEDNTPRQIEQFAQAVEGWAEQGYDFTWREMQSRLEENYDLKFTYKVPTE